MTVKIILLVTIIFYRIIVSQSFMYILALSHMQLNLDIDAYRQVRQRIDHAMQGLFRYTMYAGLVMNSVLVVSTSDHPDSILFIASSIALLLLLADTVLAVKGNVPINSVIRSWSAEHYPVNWTEYRSRWLNVFRYRQAANITGFISLLIAAVFG